MKKLILFAVLAVGAISYVPPLREAAEPVAGPLLERTSDVLGPVVAKLLDPVFRWSARGEAERYLRRLKEEQNLGFQLPTPGTFQAFVQKHATSGRGGNDPWGSPYFLEFTRDSIRVGSPGPDLESGTYDDVIVSAPRR
ncbi:MAG: hypothetical protein ACRELD_06975 [Longimicrobiales bacterium]